MYESYHNSVSSTHNILDDENQMTSSLLNCFTQAQEIYPVPFMIWKEILDNLTTFL